MTALYSTRMSPKRLIGGAMDDLDIMDHVVYGLIFASFALICGFAVIAAYMWANGI